MGLSGPLIRLVAPAWQHGSAVAPRLGPADVLHLGQRPMGHARALLHHLSGLCGFGFLAAHVCVVMLGQKRCALGRNYSDSIYLSIHPSIYLSIYIYSISFLTWDDDMLYPGDNFGVPSDQWLMF